ncbi:hypothetical protein B0H66DRAFT_634994 [Apodospora peruviana]|uniref:Aminoglycoside phosphotransferase domain-containing protein n=1 Tax=Apodospora peruviana TaxID=516989 RepID=A0AAE0IRU3_9PEZI|nr:hypothetical protein B0H66DRAFT_634994 [Apodospora peruviana]
MEEITGDPAACPRLVRYELAPATEWVCVNCPNTAVARRNQTSYRLVVVSIQDDEAHKKMVNAVAAEIGKLVQKQATEKMRPYRKMAFVAPNPEGREDSSRPQTNKGEGSSSGSGLGATLGTGQFGQQQQQPATSPAPTGPKWSAEEEAKLITMLNARTISRHIYESGEFAPRNLSAIAEKTGPIEPTSAPNFARSSQYYAAYDMRRTNGFFLGHVNREPLGNIIFTNEIRPSAGPFQSVAEFHDWLSLQIRTGKEAHWPGKQPWEIPDPYRDGISDDAAVVFTHADLHPSNIIVSSGSPCKLVALIDWRQSEWYPEYWEC